MPLKDRVKRLAYLKTYRERHREKRAAERPFYDMARHANQRARLHKVAGRITIHDIRAIFDAGSMCHYCNGSYLLGLDHVVPMSNGGFNIRENIVVACRSCNSSKWQGARPWRWSRFNKSCARCGTSERKHVALGLCNACYLHVRNLRKQFNAINHQGST